MICVMVRDPSSEWNQLLISPIYAIWRVRFDCRSGFDCYFHINALGRRLIGLPGRRSVII